MSCEPKKRDGLVPEPSLRRMPCYLTFLKLALKQGHKYASSTQIAQNMGIDPTQVTKDLAYAKVIGKTRVGYEIAPLIDALEAFLGFTIVDKAFLFGAGSLGSALLHDHGLQQFGLEIVAAFDIDRKIINKKIADVPVYHMNDFMSKCDANVKIGILTVPAEKAQDSANAIIQGGITGIWNFTPARIFVPEGIVVQNTSLYAHLAVMFNRMQYCQKSIEE